MEGTDDKKVSAASLRSISGLTDTSFEDEASAELENYDEKKWRLSHLKNQFESLELHKLYAIYTDKINHGYFSLFLILQGVLSLTHFLVLTFSNYQNKDNMIKVIPDLILYMSVFVLSMFGLYLVDKIVEKYKKLQYISLLAFAILFFVNAFVPYYHNIKDGNGNYRTAYSSHLILSCYVFFSIHDVLVSFVMGLFVSVFYIMTLILTTYAGSDMLWQRVLSEVFYLIVINGLGTYFRYMNEIVIRRSFLDRRDCIMSTFQLRHEKEQEEQLMSSIIPNNIMKKVKQNYLEATKYYLQTKRYLKKNPFENALLDKCNNVTILFADIVHYTEMTCKLNITDLLETLNDLFGWFDEASEKLKVIRIKFLGDCYYCVAGLPPDPAPNHAEACVDLGLAMISIIANVRQKRNLNINMRIGVHTGKIISGIIGARKNQFDIWSRDVDIANKMESEGKPGKVHITNTTKALLEKPYLIHSTDKGETVQQFKQYDLQTFLVSPSENNEGNRTVLFPEPNGTVTSQRRSSLFKKQRQGLGNGTILLTQLQNASIQEDEEKDPATAYLTVTKGSLISSLSSIDENGNTNDRLYKRRISNGPHRNSKLTDDRRSTADLKRRTAFMNNNIKRYAERTVAVNKEMEKTIANITYSKYEQYVKMKDINSIFLCFTSRKNEWGYITIPDPLFKYYLLSAAVLIFFVYIIQNLTLSHWGWSSWPFLATQFVIIFLFLPLSWTHFLWSRYVANIMDDPPRNILINFLCKSSKLVTNSFTVRLVIFIIIYICFGVCILMELIECEGEAEGGQIFGERYPFFLLFSSRRKFQNNEYCIIPWHMTESCILAVVMTYLFLRIFLWIKLLFAVITVTIYSYGVLSFSKGFYAGSETFNYGLEPQVAHILSVVFFTMTLHCIDRQTDYMNRLDHLLNLKLKTEQEEANELQIINKNLLLNILPKHVAKLYLDVNREMKELYYENHNDVAIMFASIIVDDDLQEILGDEHFLILMNEYITSFDTLINRKEFRTIEKIKVAKWTYMAACGLFPGGKEFEIERHVTSATLETLLSYASNMFKHLKICNQNMYNCQLRIGICHGPIVAGVVGSKKPLYDIWGDPVNMASRMDSTGIPNRIQVMENTAEIIQNLGYICDYRDKIRVKGKDDLVRTYFVRLDENYNLVKNVTAEIDDE
uniref:adenylate cyclase n=1 Tax=Anoplophora glabripennis TaxID=217634 RepID=V5G4W0_ANOGL